MSENRKACACRCYIKGLEKARSLFGPYTVDTVRTRLEQEIGKAKEGKG